MIENMSPQPFPLWLVERDGSEPLLVIGWVAERRASAYRLMPIAVECGAAGVRPAVVDTPCAFYPTQEEAWDAVVRGLGERSRR